jgi:hypothetical protein
MFFGEGYLYMIHTAPGSLRLSASVCAGQSGSGGWCLDSRWQLCDCGQHSAAAEPSPHSDCPSHISQSDTQTQRRYEEMFRALPLSPESGCSAHSHFMS